MRHPFLLLAFYAALVCAVPAHAGRPLATDDAAVVERGACELEAAAARDSAAGITGRLSTAQLTCGVPAGSEVALAAYRARREGSTAHALDLGGKTQLAGSADGSPMSSLAYAVTWAHDDAQGWRHAATRVVFVHTRGLANDLTLHANLGHAWYHEDRHRATTWGLALEHAGTGALAPMAELTGDDHAAPCWNAGLRWTPPGLKSLSFDLAYGQQLASGRPRFMTVGLTQAF